MSTTHRQQILRHISSNALVDVLDRQRAVKATYDADSTRRALRIADYHAVTDLIADIEAELSRRAAASAGVPDGEDH